MLLKELCHSVHNATCLGSTFFIKSPVVTILSLRYTCMSAYLGEVSTSRPPPLGASDKASLYNINRKIRDCNYRGCSHVRTCVSR